MLLLILIPDNRTLRIRTHSLLGALIEKKLF
jgi:hypothetical protein